MRYREQPPELFGGVGARLGDLPVDLPRAHELHERGVHRLHAVGRPGLDHRVDLVGLGLANQVANRRGRDEHVWVMIP